MPRSDTLARTAAPARARPGAWLLVVVSSLSIAAYAVTALERIGYPYELQYFEGSTVEVSARVTEGLPLYAAPTTDFTPWPYPPLYFLVTGELAKVTGISLPTMRAVSFAASLVSLVLLVLIVRHASGSPVAGAVAAGLFAGTYRVTGAWFDAARVDSLFVALLLAAIYAGLRARTWRGGVVVGVLLVLAFLTKQNALAVAIPMLAWLCLRRRSVGVPATAVVVVGAVGSVVVGDAVTGGWYSSYVVGQLLGQGTVAVWLAEFWVVDLFLPFALVVVASAVWVWRRRSSLSIGWSGGQTAYLLACVAGLVLAGLAGRVHDGGYVNVAIPAHAGVAIVLGLVVAALLADPATTSRLLAGAAAVLAVQLVVMSLWHRDVVPTAADRAAGDRVVAELRALPGRVLVLSHPYYLRLAGLPTNASLIAVGDLLATRPGPARDAMTEQLPWSLDGVGAVVVDSRGDTGVLGPELASEFTLVSTSFVPGPDFRPVTDVPTVPSLLYIRTTELNR